MTPSGSLQLDPLPSCPVCRACQTVLVRPYRSGGAVGSSGTFAGLCLRTCMRCDTTFANPFPENEELDAYYADRYRIESGRSAVSGSAGDWDGGAARARAQIEFVLRHVRPPHSWLDIGAGYGALLDEARRLGARTGAVEPDVQCRKAIEQRGHTVHARLADVSGVWHVVSCSHVLEHVTDPIRLLGTMRALLPETGVLFCEVPNETGVMEAVEDEPHLLFFTETSLKRAAEQSGLAVIAVTGCGGWGRQRAWHRGIREGVRKLSRKIVARPPRWMDHLVHPHFQYAKEPGAGSWIRLLARRR